MRVSEEIGVFLAGSWFVVLSPFVSLNRSIFLIPVFAHNFSLADTDQSYIILLLLLLLCACLQANDSAMVKYLRQEMTMEPEQMEGG